MQKFDSFVMFAEMRTGSNFLEANLNAMPGLTCHGEAFNPHFIGKKDQTSLFGIDLREREADPLAFLRKMRARTEGKAGFRFFRNHDHRILEAVLPDPLCAKIILTRNPVESYVSLKIAQETGQWKLTDAKRLKTARVRFDPAEFEAHLEATQAFQIRLMHGLQTTGQTAFYIDYDDLQDVAVLNGLARFLGVGATLAAPDETLKKQNPEDLAEKVENLEEMEAALARLDRFNLARTPNFEPRRNAAIPGFIATKDTGLLYMPVRGGPEQAVTAWLAGAGSGVVTGFTQKTLRQWKRSSLPNRSFTVLRHPLARAHVGFSTRVLTGDLPELRVALKRTYRLDLPPPGCGKLLGVAEYRAALLGFLRFLKLNLAGQTGLRVDAGFASQTAVLQGFAQMQPPDLVLREDRLQAGLDHLAAELGLCAPPLVPVPADEVHPLAAIHDAELEQAARDAYARDYAGFGFGPWKAEA